MTSRMLQKQINPKVLKPASEPRMEGNIKKNTDGVQVFSESVKSYEGDAWANHGWPPGMQHKGLGKRKGACRVDQYR